MEVKGEQSYVERSRYEGKKDLNKCYCEQVFISFMYSKTQLRMKANLKLMAVW